MYNVTLFMGKPVDYWLELERQAETLDVTKLILENGQMRRQLSFYRARVREIVDFFQTHKEEI